MDIYNLVLFHKEFSELMENAKEYRLTINFDYCSNTISVLDVNNNLIFTGISEIDSIRKFSKINNYIKNNRNKLEDQIKGSE